MSELIRPSLLIKFDGRFFDHNVRQALIITEHLENYLPRHLGLLFQQNITFEGLYNNRLRVLLDFFIEPKTP